jgi:hypothetical protein
LIRKDSDPIITDPNCLAEILLKELCCCEESMVISAMNKVQYDTAEGHCQQCLSYVRKLRIEGEKKTTYIFRSLSMLCSLREHQARYSESATFAEEAYNLVVEAYDPVHPQVQEAAGLLINILIVIGNLFDAERYAQVTYGNLRDKKNGMDQESEAVAMGAFNLACVTYRQNVDLIKAEELARESLRIRSLIYDSDDSKMALCYNLIARILQAQNKLGDETRDLFKRSLTIAIRNEGPDTDNDMTGKVFVGKFHHQLAYTKPTLELRRKELFEAKLYFQDIRRISSKIFGPTHLKTLDTELVPLTGIPQTCSPHP